MRTRSSIFKHVVFPFFAAATATVGPPLCGYFSDGILGASSLFVIPVAAGLIAFLFSYLSADYCSRALMAGALPAPLCVVSFLTMVDPVGIVLVFPFIGFQVLVVLAGKWLGGGMRQKIPST